jgi:ketosteroid isomerase-like protein
MDFTAVQDWLDRYIAAWNTYDEAAIQALFAENATYRYHPYDDEYLHGRDAIVQNWLENRDDPGTFEARYEPYAVDGDRAVALGWSRYYEDASKAKLLRIYDNVFVMRFDADGRCVEFTEYFMQEPAKT